MPRTSPDFRFPVADALRDSLPLDVRLDAPLGVFGPTDRFRRLARSQGWKTPRDLVVAGPTNVLAAIRERRGKAGDLSAIRGRLEAWLGRRWEEVRVELGFEAHPAPLPPSSPLLRAPLADLDLAVGVLRVAARLGWKTVGDLVAVPPERFEKFGGVGPVSAARVEAKIAAHLGMPWEAAWRSTRATNVV
jgi:hypothetical protein